MKDRIRWPDDRGHAVGIVPKEDSTRPTHRRHRSSEVAPAAIWTDQKTDPRRSRGPGVSLRVATGRTGDGEANANVILTEIGVERKTLAAEPVRTPVSHS